LWKEESKLSSLLSRNYYTIAHDLNPTEEKLEENNEKNEEKTQNEILLTSDELNFMDNGGGKLTITVGNPEKAQTPMESYITYEVKTETDRIVGKNTWNWKQKYMYICMLFF